VVVQEEKMKRKKGGKMGGRAKVDAFICFGCAAKSVSFPRRTRAR
jgi:hypothetical protein